MKTTFAGAVAVLLLSLWIGFQIDPRRDWIAWLFFAGPIVLLGIVAAWQVRKHKLKGGKDEA